CRAPSGLPSDDSFGWKLQLDASSALTIWCESLGDPCGPVRGRPALEIVIVTTKHNALAPETNISCLKSKQTFRKRSESKQKRMNRTVTRFVSQSKQQGMCANRWEFHSQHFHAIRRWTAAAALPPAWTSMFVWYYDPSGWHRMSPIEPSFGTHSFR